jgi:hypothetical protein
MSDDSNVTPLFPGAEPLRRLLAARAKAHSPDHARLLEQREMLKAIGRAETLTKMARELAATIESADCAPLRAAAREASVAVLATGALLISLYGTTDSGTGRPYYENAEATADLKAAPDTPSSEA